MQKQKVTKKKQEVIYIDKDIFKSVVNRINRDKVINIQSNTYTYGICATEILKSIFEKEMIKYEISFKLLHSKISFQFEYDGVSYVLSNNIFEEECQCDRVLTSLSMMMSIARSMKVYTVDTAWAYITAASFYIHYDFTENVCDWCINQYYSLKETNLKKHSATIKKENKVKLAFLHESTLFNAIKNDIRTVCYKKLFYSKFFDRESKENQRNIPHSTKNYSDPKIFEFLAKEGISICTANETYKNLDYEQKEKIEGFFRCEDILVYKHKHDFEILGIEHFMLISFYTHVNKSMNGFLSLTNKNYFKNTKYLQFMDIVMYLFKELVKTIKKAENTMVFSLKTTKHIFIKNTTDLDLNLMHILDKMMKIYINFKFEEAYNYVIVVENKEECILYSTVMNFMDSDYALGNNIKDIDNFIVVSKKDYKRVIKEMTTF